MKTYTLQDIFDVVNKRFDEQSNLETKLGTLETDKRIAKMEAFQQIKKDFFELEYGKKYDEGI